MFFEISARCCVLFSFDAYLLLIHIDKFYFYFCLYWLHIHARAFNIIFINLLILYDIKSSVLFW